MTRRPISAGLARLGLAPRLLLNNLLVIVAGAGTVVLTVLLVAPAVFQLHLRRAAVPLDAKVLEHIGRAVDQAVLVSVGVGVVIATFTASTISWLVARRLAAAVAEAADTGRHLADGHLDARVLDPGMGPELATLTTSLNDLAERLQSTETTRRELTADLAHQLRTPITSIEATLEAVREHVLPPDDLTLETLTAQSARLRRLVADLEVVSRAEERQLLLNVEPVAIPALVEEALGAQRERYRAAGIHLEATINPGLPLVLVDPDRIQEALGCLLDNALRHTPPGGTVTLTAQPRDTARSAPAQIIVSDTGDGFPPSEAEHLFHRFTKGPHSTGSGLGLTIARALVEAHHGTLLAHSDGPGNGARFTITLPPANPARS
ncbi:Signal transduction histidine kinase [Raineyella antarctica]|uniref:histidine kinase n=1 Tax=Raineyella antarctica TaxID=1577474 RepID=A0A1G6GD16_9ACTN|nr:HAMP domain-containing sensor histidine kinase [Raineyella antarctica]SDB79743.1 Signal transduction histidine kinase [Raineyella antarctica]